MVIVRPFEGTSATVPRVIVTWALARNRCCPQHVRLATGFNSHGDCRDAAATVRVRDQVERPGDVRSNQLVRHVERKALHQFELQFRFDRSRIESTAAEGLRGQLSGPVDGAFARTP